MTTTETEVLAEDHTEADTAPLPFGVSATEDVDRRLARVAAHHTPYNDHAEDATGLMCRECGYLDPCPTRRMTMPQTDPAGPWLTSDER